MRKMLHHEHEYKYKKTKRLLKQLTPYWIRYQKLLERFDIELDIINKSMLNDDIGIPGIMIIESNFGTGIGNMNRSMELIQSFEFEEGKLCP
jgi:hypothetical protein